MTETATAQTPPNESLAASGAPGTAPTHAQPAIVAQQLCKYYGQFAAVSNISFTVGTGTVTAFLGPNGAGKSTTMKMLTGFLAPSSGTALLAGYDMTGPDRLLGSQKLGYLPENGPLYREMTPSQFLRFIADARQLRGGDASAALDRVTEACQLAEVWHKPIRKLSKGFKQRVGLAQAILHDPEILILDEPTSGLDPNQILGVRELIRELAQTKTILLSTHILQEVEAMADSVLLVSDGRLVFSGTPTELAGEQGMEKRFHELTTTSGGNE